MVAAALDGFGKGAAVKPSADVLALNPGLAEMLGKVVEEAAPEVACERDLQEACEAWLVARGYRRRTEGMIAAGMPPRGWFVHLHRAVGNPLLLDLLILGNDGRFLEVELKGPKTAVERHQAKLLGMGGRLCRDLAGFVAVVSGWEGGK